MKIDKGKLTEIIKEEVGKMDAEYRKLNKATLNAQRAVGDIMELVKMNPAYEDLKNEALGLYKKMLSMLNQK